MVIDRSDPRLTWKDSRAGRPGQGVGRVRVLLICALVLWVAVGVTFSFGLSAAAAGADVDAAQSAERAPGYPWRWPVQAARHVVVPFLAPAHEYGPGHRGMDISAEPGSPVHAPAAGVVAFRGTVVDRALITIDHGDGYVTTLEPVESDLHPGDAVAAGDVVGVVASGGHAVRGTMHVGVRLDGRYVNPRGFFGAVPRAVLLPCCAG